MKDSYFLLVFILILFLVNSACSEQSPQVIDNIADSELSKKPSGDSKTSGVKYSSTLVPSAFNFNVFSEYYDDTDCENCYDQTYLYPPVGLESENYITLNVDAYSLNSKDWFNTIIVVVEPDLLEPLGVPDNNESIILFGKSLGYYDKFTELENPVTFYWWGQKREVDPITYKCCLRMLQVSEKGQYLIRISLRQELKNKKGKFGVHQEVYSSLDDPNFQSYDGIQQGYVPIIVN